MKIMDFVSNYLFRDLLTHFVPGLLIWLAVWTPPNARNQLKAYLMSINEIGGVPSVAILAIMVIYATGFLNWLILYFIREKIFSWNDIDRSMDSGLAEVVDGELRSLYGDCISHINEVSRYRISAFAAYIAAPDQFNSHIERELSLWNFQMGLSGSLFAWGFVLLIPIDLNWLGIVAIILASAVFYYSKGSAVDIRSNQQCLFIASLNFLRKDQGKFVAIDSDRPNPKPEK